MILKKSSSNTWIAYGKDGKTVLGNNPNTVWNYLRNNKITLTQWLNSSQKEQYEYYNRALSK